MKTIEIILSTTKTDSIKITITTKGSNKKDVVIGSFTNGRLHISFDSLPKLICILIDEPFCANEGEECLRLIREKLDNCEFVTRSGSAIRYHATSSHEYVYGAAKNESEYFQEAFVERDYFIEYSLYDLTENI